MGISHDQTSARLKGLAVLFYVLGMSYGAVALARAALGCPLSKVAVYNAVQAAGARVAGLRREAARHGGGRVVGLGVDLTSVRGAGQWLTVGVGVVAGNGLALAIDLLPNGEAATLTAWGQDLAAAIGAAVLVSDDADGFKTAADANGLDQQVGKTHVLRNTEAWVEERARRRCWPATPTARWPPSGWRRSTRWPIAGTCLRLMTERRPSPAASATLEAIHRRYLAAPKPRAGEPMSLAYRLRLFSLDRGNRWDRLTRYRTWAGPDGATLDGTNTACERARGALWAGWVKERYRPMRGSKRAASVLNVSRLIAAMGNALDGPGFPLAEVVA